MKLTCESCIGFIGFGLIGGSIARCLRKQYPNTPIIAYNYKKNHPNHTLETAQQNGTLSQIVTDLASFLKCDLIFLCAPVKKNIEYLNKLKPIIKKDCIITDVGSVKGNIHDMVIHLSLEAQFIGGHPMAGSEKTGYENSNTHLLENAYYILTPTKKTPSDVIVFMEQLISNIGAIPILLDPKEHDNITAAISHVPHIIASTLVNMVQDNDDKEEKMRALAAGGFKDITRIASSSPIMWENICMTNISSIQTYLRLFCDSLEETINDLESENKQAILHTFERAKEYRDSIPSKAIGMIKEVFELYIDIIDETGAIATIATILASNGISIKNIGILHNREFQDGALRIELYDSISKHKAAALLTQYRYTIYER